MRIRLSYVILLAALALGAAFDVLFFEHEPEGINVLLAEVLFIGFSLALAKSQKIVVPFAAKVAAGFSLAFAATFAIWTSQTSTALAFVGFLVANTLFAVFMLGEAAHFRHPFDILASLVVTPIKHAVHALPFVRTLMPERLSPKAASVVKALLIATPILLVFIAIFSAADPVFNSYIENFFTWIENWLNLGNVITHGFFIGFFVVLFGLFFAASFWKRREHAPKAHNTTARAILESKIILGSVAVLFALFLIISSVALFGGEAAFDTLGVTYSEYARQGFGQLSAAAALVIGLIMTLRVLHSEKVDKHLVGLQGILLVEAGLVLISAFMRLSMYIGAYGYTPARLFGLWFFTLVGVVLLMTLANVVTRRSQQVLVTQMLVVSGLAMLLFVASAPDARAVRLNAGWAANNGKELPLDHSIYALSAEAYPTIIDVYSAEVPKEDVRALAPSVADYCSALASGKRLHEMTDEERALYDDYMARREIFNLIHNSENEHTDSAWQTWNWSRYRAAQLGEKVKETPEWLQNVEALIASGFTVDYRGLGTSPLCDTLNQ